MTAAVFVVEPTRLAGCAAGTSVLVDGPEGRHGASVRRLRPGEAVDLVDGEGLRASGVVAAVPGPDRFQVTVERATVEPPPVPRIVVALALLKGDRMESAVEMLTEVGVDEIVPWAAQRSVARWRPERIVKARSRLAATIHAAGKQSRRARFPVLAKLVDAAALGQRVAAADQAIVLHEEATEQVGSIEVRGSGEVLLVIGPEGGIAPDEVAALAEAGATATKMGPLVLRAGTAAAAGAAVVMARSGRWGSR